MMQVKQISDNEIYLLIKYIKCVLWRVAKRLSYIEDARCLKVNSVLLFAIKSSKWSYPLSVFSFFDENAVCLKPVHFRHVPFVQSFSIWTLWQIRWRENLDLVIAQSYLSINCCMFVFIYLRLNFVKINTRTPKWMKWRLLYIIA